MTTPVADNPTQPKAIAICCGIIILALVVGVGLASNLVLRHLVQTLPLWIGVVLGFRRSRATGWIALPSFVFWLVLMMVIWLYLLGVAHFISGHFSIIEIAMTIVVGIAAVVGITMFWRLQSHLSPWRALSLFVILAALQWACFRVSTLPAIAHR